MTKSKSKGIGIGIDSKLPFVSVCTPTFNRRPFVEMMIKLNKEPKILQRRY
jgi:hypothetical protein